MQVVHFLDLSKSTCFEYVCGLDTSVTAAFTTIKERATCEDCLIAIASKGSTEAHQDLGKAFFKALSAQYPDLVMIPYTVGMFRDFDSAERIVRAGQKGVPDWIVFGNGWYRLLDAKTGKARFSTEQKEFAYRLNVLNSADMVFKLTSVEQGLEIIRNAIKGI